MQRLLIHEVGFRDGLQMEKQVVPTEQKIAWIAAALRSGVDVVQVGSFVHPDKVPQMADTDRLFAHFGAAGRKPNGFRRRGEPGAGPMGATSRTELLRPQAPDGVTLSALVLNEKGLERGLACGVEMLCMGVSASETHSRKNTGMAIAEANQRIVAMAKRALAEGRKIQVSVQSAFGCGYEGRVPKERVVAIVKTFLDAGLRSLSLADTAGHATPDDVAELFGRVRELEPGAEWTCHFHNTYGLALANCYAARLAGVTSFESSVAGLGGCPFTKVAGGNTCTEDLVHALQRAGLRPDVKLPVLLELANDMARFFQRDLPGALYRSGPIPEPNAMAAS